MISDITDLDYALLKDNIDIKEKNKKDTKTYFLIEFDKEDNIIIELNKDSYAKILIKNIICILMGIKNNPDEYQENLTLIQIHLNYELNFKEVISKYRIKDYKIKNSYQSILCIELSPLNCSKLYYSNEKKSNIIKWGTFLNSDTKEEAQKILENILKQPKE